MLLDFQCLPHRPCIGLTLCLVDLDALVTGMLHHTSDLASLLQLSKQSASRSLKRINSRSCGDVYLAFRSWHPAALQTQDSHRAMMAVV